MNIELIKLGKKRGPVNNTMASVARVAAGRQTGKKGPGNELVTNLAFVVMALSFIPKNLDCHSWPIQLDNQLIEQITTDDGLVQLCITSDR